jgi:hypothetical protein
MRSRLLLLLALLAVPALGCGARSSLSSPLASEPGTGGTGGAPTIPSNIVLTQGGMTQQVQPIERSEDVVSFYGYASSSAHTGFEALGKSELFFYVDTTSGVLSLVTEHGIDINSSGQAQPMSSVDQELTGLPLGVTVAIADDTPMEFSLDSPTSARGAWNFNQNTDGGVLSGFPLPGSWAVTITSDFIVGIDTWRFFGPEEIPLDLTQPVTLTSMP